MPYPQKGVATGILFGNSKETPEDKLSPSLDVVKEAAMAVSDEAAQEKKSAFAQLLFCFYSKTVNDGVL